MIIEIIKTGEKREVNASYGTRLIEQGVAVAANDAPAEAPAPKKGKAAGDA